MYNSAATFASYDVPFVDAADSAGLRDALRAALPESHLTFIQNLDWVVDKTYPWGRLVAVHAGLQTEQPLSPQLDALARRDLADPALFSDGDRGRLAPLCDRRTVRGMHPELAAASPTAVLVSGHHGFADIGTERVILDASGGRPGPGQPLQALILPERCVLGSDGSARTFGRSGSPSLDAASR